MLAEFPEDFLYVLALQEAVAVGMADGFAQASGRPAHVNLHTAPGVGNGLGRLQRPGEPFAAAGHRRPAGPGAGDVQANLTNREATRVVHPFVKWSYEPPRAADVPHALARAIHIASLPPKGPAFVSSANGRLDRGGRRVVDGGEGPDGGVALGPGPGGDLLAREAPL